MTKTATPTLDKTAALLGIALLVSLMLCIGSFVYMQKHSAVDQHSLQLIDQQSLLAQTIASKAVESATANTTAFPALVQSQQQFALNLERLRQGSPGAQLPSPPRSPQEQLTALVSLWNTLNQDVHTILAAESGIRELQGASGKITTLLFELGGLSDELLSRMMETGATAKQVYVASQQQLLIPQLARQLDNLFYASLRLDSGAMDIAQALEKNVIQFGRILDAMQDGSRAMGISKLSDGITQDKLVALGQRYRELQTLLSALLAQAPALSKAQLAAQHIQQNGAGLLARCSALRDAYAAQAAQRPLQATVAYVLAAISLLLFILLALRLLRRARFSAHRSGQQNQGDQQAIQRLLNEISNLADGDLTIHATVGNDITAAIAEAINYTIDQLRRLISTINQVTEQVSSAAQSTQATAMHLAEASDQQAEQIMTVTGAIKQMAESIDTVSINADRSSEVAATSLAIAKKGALAVQNSIRGMDTIREQIQATAKRIKRLGESSQEIADMVELINDIADQTNILALNAAIQASMAGESGHGFAVVADEVQGLAEKSTAATRQIETLVNTILADTHEAVASMEQSTAQVVAGAKITQDAGEALTEIENVSNLLADLTQSISGSAQQQAAAASSISASMNVIQHVTSQNLTGTNKTSASVGHLAELADALRKSIAGFKLPGPPQ